MLFNLLMAGGEAAPVLQAKTNINPSTSSQTIQPDTGYDGLSSVQINAMPAMTLPTAASGTASGTNKATISPSTSVQYINIPTGYNASAARYTLSAMPTMTLPTAASSSSSGTSKATIQPSESNQYINIPTGYNSAGAYYLIAAISNTYVGTGITRRSSSDLTASGLTVNAPAGYYQSAATKTLTDANLVADNIKKNVSIFGVTGSYEGDGGGGSGGSSSVQVDTINGAASGAGRYIEFHGLSGEPTSFAIMLGTSGTSPATDPVIVGVVYDGTDLHAQTITNTSNAQVSYSTDVSMQYISGELYISTESLYFDDSNLNEYTLVYTYDGSSSDIHTANVQVGSGATSITFPGLSRNPIWWACIFKSNFGTSSGYQRVIQVVNNGTAIYGLEMDSSAKTAQHWSASYSGGSLTISSNGTNQGGYFHQPGYYELVYAVDDSAPAYQAKTGVAASTSSQTIYPDSGYDALESVQINAVSQTNLTAANIKSGTTVNISNGSTNLWSVTGTYTGGGGGSASIDTKTTTSSNRPTSLSFTSMKGQPLAFVLRCTSSMSRSSSSTYYYVAMMRYNGTNTTGNCWRMSNGNWTNITSGYSFTYSNGTLTLSSNGSSTTSPGCFYPGNYELVYVY